jgi:hypothetical protein
LFNNLSSINNLEKLTVFLNNNNLKELYKFDHECINEFSVFLEDNLIENITDFS